MAGYRAFSRPAWQRRHAASAMLAIAVTLGLGAGLMPWVTTALAETPVKDADAPAADSPTTKPSGPSTRPAGVISATDPAALKKALDTGKLVEIEGTIAHAEWSRSGKVLTLVFRTAAGLAGDEPGVGLVGAVFGRDREAFDKEFAGDVAKTLTGAKVRVRGKLGPYGGYEDGLKGCPQIILNRPTQVTLLKKAE